MVFVVVLIELLMIVLWWEAAVVILSGKEVDLAIRMQMGVDLSYETFVNSREQYFWIYTVSCICIIPQQARRPCWKKIYEQ